MIDALDESRHCRSSRASRLGAGKGEETREQRVEEKNVRDSFHKLGGYQVLPVKTRGVGRDGAGSIVRVLQRGGRRENADPPPTAVLFVADAFGAMADREAGFAEQVGIIVREGHLASVDETLPLCRDVVVGPDRFDQQDCGGLSLRGNPSEEMPKLLLEEIFEDPAVCQEDAAGFGMFRYPAHGFGRVELEPGIRVGRAVNLDPRAAEIDPGELKHGGIAFRQEGEQPAPAAADLVKMLGRLARVCPFGDPSIEQRDNFKVAPEEDPLEAIIPVVVELRRVFAPVGGKEATEPGLVSLDEGLPEESVPDQGSQPVGPFAENLAWWPRGKRGHSRDREDA